MKHAKSILTAALCLVTICLVVTLAVAGTRYAFQDEISAQEWQAKETAMKELLPATSYEAIKTKTGEVYAAVSNEKTQGYLITTSAYGYGSDVSVMTAIQEGVIKEVRVLDASEETPGLGQNVTKESFTSQFQGLEQAPALSKSSAAGTIEALTGATRSSNAVANAVATAFTTYQEITSQKGGASPHGK